MIYSIGVSGTKVYMHVNLWNADSTDYEEQVRKRQHKRVTPQLHTFFSALAYSRLPHSLISTVFRVNIYFPFVDLLAVPHARTD